MSKILFFLITLTVLQTQAQINPVQNLEWEHFYISPNNYFNLSWEAPAEPHDELVGYYIYRDADLYRFQEEIGVYHLPDGSNSDLDFLDYGVPGEGFYAYVSAVYTSEHLESARIPIFIMNDLFLDIPSFNQSSVKIYPNPVKDNLYFEGNNVQSVVVYDMTGKKLTEYNEVTSPIRFSGFDKGVYMLHFYLTNGFCTAQILIKQ